MNNTSTPVVAPAATPGRLARWAIGLAETAVGLTALAIGTYAVGYAVGGDDAVSDNWVGMLSAGSYFGAVGMSLAAFALGVTAKVRHDHSPRLWLPLAVLPALVAFVVLGEAFWWE
jgi:hypothetical protein